MREYHRLLSIFEPKAVLTDNIWGYLWGKLGYGSLLFATALTNASMSENLRLRAPLRGLSPPRAGGDGGGEGPRREARRLQRLRPGRLHARSRMRAAARRSVADMAEFNRHTAKTHSGIWRDLAVRKRKTEVDAQIGIIGTLARRSASDARHRRLSL